MKWLKKLMGCQCWACKNVRLGGGYQPCHNQSKGGESISKPPRYKGDIPPPPAPPPTRKLSCGKLIPERPVYPEPVEIKK